MHSLQSYDPFYLPSPGTNNCQSINNAINVLTLKTYFSCEHCANQKCDKGYSNGRKRGGCDSALASIVTRYPFPPYIFAAPTWWISSTHRLKKSHQAGAARLMSKTCPSTLLHYAHLNKPKTLVVIVRSYFLSLFGPICITLFLGGFEFYFARNDSFFLGRLCKCYL